MAGVFQRSLRQLDRQTIWAGVQIGLFMLGGYVFQTAGLQFTTPSKAAFITGCSVVLVPLLLSLFRARHQFLDLVWRGRGAAWLVFPHCAAEGFGALNRGDVLVFVCAIMFALH